MTGPMRSTIAAILLLASAGVGERARAQDFGDAFDGLSSSSSDPIQIEADRLDVRNEERMAVYSGRVRLRQGSTVLQTAELRIYYAGEPTGTAPGSSVQRIEASGRVVVTSRGQSASGDRAVFEVAKDLVTLSGNVVVSDADNVVRGDHLYVNLKTKKAQIEGGRVQTIFRPRGEGAN